MQIRINLENFDLVDTLELLKRSFADLILLTTSNLERKFFLKPCPSPPFLILFILLLIDILVREHFSSSSASPAVAQVESPGSRPPSANHLQSRLWGGRLTCENPELFQRCSPLHVHLLPHCQLVRGLKVAKKKCSHQTVAQL